MVIDKLSSGVAAVNVLFNPRKVAALLAAWILFLATGSAHSAEGVQKLRVAYAAITAAFSIPWIAKEAGIFQRHGLDVELVYIPNGSRAVQTLLGGSIDIAAIGGPAGGGGRPAGAGNTLHASSLYKEVR